MRFINKHTLRQISNTACTVKSFRQLKNDLVVAGTSQLRIYKFYTQDEVRNGDLSFCIIENILLYYQV